MLAKRSGLIWLVLTAVVLVLDWVTKTMVVDAMTLRQSIDVLPFFNITYVHNYGAAFSFLSDAGGWQRHFLSAIAIIISVLLLWWLKKLPANQTRLACAYSLILAGALGNLYDRIHYGYVIDFIHVYYKDWHYPAFNIADCAICIGAGLLLIDAFMSGSKKESVNE